MTDIFFTCEPGNGVCIDKQVSGKCRTAIFLAMLAVANKKVVKIVGYLKGYRCTQTTALYSHALLTEGE